MSTVNSDSGISSVFLILNAVLCSIFLFANSADADPAAKLNSAAGSPNKIRAARPAGLTDSQPFMCTLPETD